MASGCSLRVCEWLDWKSPNGKPKEMSYSVALLKLQRRGHIFFQSRALQVDYVPKEKSALSLPEIESLRCRLKTLGEIELVLVESKDRTVSISGIS